MSNYEKIREIIKENGGFILTSDLKKHNIHRQYLKKLEEQGEIFKNARGVYTTGESWVNDFFISANAHKNAVVSHNTALYIYKLTDRTPFSTDLTFPSTVRINDSMISPHYIKKELLELGLTTKKMEDGTSIRVYDLERTICDIIRDRNKMDPQIFNMAMKEYFKLKDKDLNKLYKYAKAFRIEKILKQYVEVLG